MIPFASIEFYILIFTIVGLIILGKLVLKSFHYKYLLALVNAFFLAFVFVQPVHFFLLIVFAYVATYLMLNVLRIENKLWGVLFLVLPMFIVKLDIRLDEYSDRLNDLISFVGLSYATFRMVSYYMDRRIGEKMANPFSYFNYLAFTPIILMGPIDKFARFESSESRGFANITTDNFIAGWNAFVKGVVAKYIIAEVISRYWMNYYSDLTQSTELLHMSNTMYSYYCYLIFDFGGYSLMVIGIAKMIGIEVPTNFKNPFVAVNPQDFWKRFHITLGDWLKDYFFTPMFLFLSRRKTFGKNVLARQNAALFLTFLLMGCWNGFNLRFIISGALFGMYSVVHNTYVSKCRNAGRDVVFGGLSPQIVKVVSILIMLNLGAFSIYIFSGYFPY